MDYGTELRTLRQLETALDIPAALAFFGCVNPRGGWCGQTTIALSGEEQASCA